MNNNFVWKNMTRDISKHIKNCSECKKNKYLLKTKQKMVITETPKEAFETIQMDLVGILPTTENNNKYILTVQCELSAFVILVPLQNKEALTVAKALFENVISKFGVPQTIKSDRGTEFINETMQELTKLLKISQIFSTSYHR